VGGAEELLGGEDAGSMVSEMWNVGRAVDYLHLVELPDGVAEFLLEVTDAGVCRGVR